MGPNLSEHFALSLKTSCKYIIFPSHRKQQTDLQFLDDWNIGDLQKIF